MLRILNTFYKGCGSFFLLQRFRYWFYLMGVYVFTLQHCTEPESELYFDTFCCLVAISCLIFDDPMDYSPPGSAVHGISQARILKWFTILFSRDSFQPRDQTRVSCIGRRILHCWATWEALVKFFVVHYCS